MSELSSLPGAALMFDSFHPRRDGVSVPRGGSPRAVGRTASGSRSRAVSPKALQDGAPA